MKIMMQKWTKKRWRNEIIALVLVVAITAVLTCMAVRFILLNMI